MNDTDSALLLRSILFLTMESYKQVPVKLPEEMDFPVATPYMQRRWTTSDGPAVGWPHPEPRQQVTLTESSERHRAFSDGDVHCYTSHTQDFQVALRPEQDSIVYEGMQDSPDSDVALQSRPDINAVQAPSSSLSAPFLQGASSHQSTENFLNLARSSSPESQHYYLTRAATAPASIPNQPPPPRFRKLFYCSRCLFWLDPNWIHAVSVIKNIKLVDTCYYGLSARGVDAQGQLRINTKCCSICDQERHIVKLSPDDEEEDFLMDQFDRILDIWKTRGLVKGMTQEEMQAKLSMMPPEKPRFISKAKRKALAAAAGKED